MDAFVLNYRSLVFSPSKLISNKIVLLLLGDLNLKDVWGFLSYNKYFFKKFSVKSIGMILFYFIYILVLFFFVIGRKIWVFKEEIVLSVIELLFYGLLLLFSMWFIYYKYLGVVFVMFILSVSFLFVSFILFNVFRLFYKLLVRILSGEKVIMQVMLLFLVCSTHLYYGLFVLDFLFFRKYGIINKQFITLLGVFLYVRESLFFYLPFYYMRTLGLLDYLGLFFHLMSKFWILSRDMVNVIRNRNRIWFYVTNHYYWNIYFDVYLLFGGYNFIYDYFYDYLFLSKDLLRTTGGVVLFLEIVFELLLNLIFWLAVILALVLRQLLVFLAYLFVSVYSWFVLYFNVGLNHVGVFCRFVWWRIWGFLLFCFWKIWMFFDFFFSFFRMLFSFIFFSEFKYWIWNSLLWNNVIFRLHDDVKFNFNFGFYVSHFHFKKRLQSLIWIKYIRLNTKERVIVNYNYYVGLSLKRIVLEFFFYRLKIIMSTYLGALLGLVKRFLNWVEWTPRLFNKVVDMVLRFLFLIIRVYNNIVLQYMNYNLVFLNYIYSVRDYIWIINWILLTQSGFPFWWRGRLFFSSLKFNRKYFFFSSLVELFEGLNFWTGHYYNASLFFRYKFYFSSMSFFWDILWARFRVDFTSIFKLFSNEKAVGFFRDFYFYSILPFNLFKTRSNAIFFLDFNFIFNLLDTSLVFNNNLYVNKLNVSKTGVYGIQKIFFFIRSFLKRLIMVFYLPLFVLLKALKFFVIIIVFIYVFMPIVLGLVLINIIIRILLKVLIFMWEEDVLVFIENMIWVFNKSLKFIWKEIKREFNINEDYIYKGLEFIWKIKQKFTLK